MNFADRLIAAIEEKGTPSLVGIDPRYAMLPAGLRKAGDAPTRAEAAAAIEEFSLRLVDVVAPLVPAVKPNIAFFEALANLNLARALLAGDGTEVTEKIEACLDRGSRLVSQTGGRVLEPQMEEERARLLRIKGDERAAARSFERAITLYREIGADGHAARLAASS